MGDIWSDIDHQMDEDYLGVGNKECLKAFFSWKDVARTVIWEYVNESYIRD